MSLALNELTWPEFMQLVLLSDQLFQEYVSKSTKLTINSLAKLFNHFKTDWMKHTNRSEHEDIYNQILLWSPCASTHHTYFP